MNDLNLIDLIQNTKSLVEYVNKSKKFNCVLANDIEVRFDSKYLLIDSILKNIDKLQLNDDLNLKNLIKKIDLNLLKKLHLFLDFIFRIRLKLCTDKHPTLNLVLPTYYTIKNFCESTNNDDSRIVRLKQIYLKNFILKFKIRSEHKLATLLTPRFKNLDNMLDEEEKSKLIIDLDDKIKNLTFNCNLELDTDENSFKRQKTLSQVQDYVEENFSKEEELKLCPISFWQKYNNRFPQLSSYALKILIPPATSCRIEEVFSQCGIFLTSRRSNLLTEKANKSLFVKINNDL